MSNKIVLLQDSNSNALYPVVNPIVKKYVTIASGGSYTFADVDFSNYREIGLVFQGANSEAPYWIEMPTSSITVQVGTVVNINGSTTAVGITHGNVTINASTNTVTNVDMNLLFTVNAGSSWGSQSAARSITGVFFR